MPIHVNWYDNNCSIKHWQFIDPWRPQDYADLLSDAIAVSNIRPHTIATIMDFSQSKRDRAHAMTLLKIGGKRTPKNLDVVVFVGNAFIAGMVSMYQQVNPLIHYDVYTTRTLPEAIQKIEQHRQRHAIS